MGGPRDTYARMNKPVVRQFSLPTGIS
jgi:hypothetical protein